MSTLREQQLQASDKQIDAAQAYVRAYQSLVVSTLRKQLLQASDRQIDAAQAYVRAYNDWERIYHEVHGVIGSNEEREAWNIMWKAKKQFERLRKIK